MDQNLEYSISEDQNIKVGDYIECYNTESTKPRKILMQVARIDECGTTFGSKIDQQYLIFARRQLKYCKKIILDRPKK